VDLIGPADAITFTGATPTGSGTIDKLKFGTTGGGTAVFTQDAGTVGPRPAGDVAEDTWCALVGIV
jgi:hypothetical protein